MRQVYLDDFRNVKVDLTTGLALEVSRGPSGRQAEPMITLESSSAKCWLGWGRSSGAAMGKS